MNNKYQAFFIVMMLCFVSAEASAYKFLCNGMDANGTVQGDGCGACDDSNAARWSPAIVNVKYDSQTVPSGVSTAEWTAALNTGLDVWSNVSGSILDLDNGGHSSSRQLGQNDNDHEVIWILSVNEWRSEVGGGENGTLGVTLPRNICPYGSQNFRQILDADMALNGTGAFDWSTSCSGWNCSSVLSTFVHEMGHFVGLDHPCTQCDWAVMSAQAYTEPEAPLLDDQNGLRALYPGVGGGIGYGCDDQSDCNAGYSCILFNEASFCSQTCSGEGDCPEGYECTDVNGQNYCTFATGSLAAMVGEGENCYQRRCEEGLVCAGSGGSDYYCYRICQSDSDCSENQTCMDSGNDESLCVSTSGDAQVGQPCGDSNLCAEGLICTGMDDNSYLCRTECSPATGAECAANETCFELSGGSGACFPMGSVLEGGVCEDPMDCAVGKLCLTDSADGTAHCYQRCDQGYTCSDSQQQCIEMQGVSYCSPLLGSGSSTGNGTDGTGEGTGDGTGDGSSDGSSDGNNTGGTGTSADGDENCNLNRGNWDCPNTHGCIDNGDGDEWGICTEGVYGRYGTGDMCEENADCNSGICDRGLCTRPCDENNGCDSTFTCEAEMLPADSNGSGSGLCRPVSCLANPDICPGGTTCIYRDTFQRNVCAAGASSGCGCSTADSTATPWWLFSLLGIWFFRRRED
jgi:MYXO-CTERM domain-containing protein